MGLIKGDFGAAVGGPKIIDVAGVEFDLSNLKAKDIAGFQEIPFTCGAKISGKEVSMDAALKIMQAYKDWFKKKFLDADPSLAEDEYKREQMEKYVESHYKELQTEFKIGLGIITREEHEKQEKELVEKLEKEKND